MNTPSWQCYSNGYKTLQAFNSLNEMSATLGVDASQIEYAANHYHGNLGGFLFIKK